MKRRLKYLNPESVLREKRQHAADLEERLRSSMEHKLTEKRHELAVWIQRFEGLSPLKKAEWRICVCVRHRRTCSYGNQSG